MVNFSSRAGFSYDPRASHYKGWRGLSTRDRLRCKKGQLMVGFGRTRMGASILAPVRDLEGSRGLAARQRRGDYATRGREIWRRARTVFHAQ